MPVIVSIKRSDCVQSYRLNGSTLIEQQPGLYFGGIMSEMNTDHNVYYPKWVFVTIILFSILVPILVALLFANIFAPFMM